MKMNRQLAPAWEAARDWLNEQVEAAQSYFDERSERWQEGEAGDMYQSWIDELQSVADQLDEGPQLDLEEASAADVDLSKIEAVRDAFYELPTSPNDV